MMASGASAPRSTRDSGQGHQLRTLKQLFVIKKKGEAYAFLLAALVLSLMFFVAIVPQRSPTGLVFGVQTDVAACGALTDANSTLTTNVSSTGTCFTFGCDNCFLDCNGYTVTFNTAGGDSEQGIIATGRDNVTVKNCVIRDGNAGGLSGIGIKLSGTNNSVIFNNTVFTNGTSINVGIQLQDSTSDAVTANSVTTRGSGSSNYGIDLVTTSRHNVTGNTIRTNGTLLNLGIRLATSTNSTVVGNTLTTGGSGTLNHGILFTDGASENNVSTNTISTNGSGSSHGIRMQTSSNNNTLLSNNITTFSSTSYAVSVITSNGSRFNNTVFSTPNAWLSTGADTINSFANTTFYIDGNGSIRIPSEFTLPDADVTRGNLDIGLNRTFMNSTNLTFLNTSAEITLNGLTFTNPQPVVDFEDDGTFTACSAEVCTETSYAGGVFVFNVSHWTSFAAQETVSACGDLSASTTLSNNVSSAGTCFHMVSDNIVLDCDGYTITFYTGVGDSEGVNATNRNNVTIKNCVIRGGNAAGASGAGIRFTSTNNSFILNDTIRANGTSANYGVHLRNSSNVNTVSNTTITTNGTSSNYGVFISASSNNTVDSNTVATQGTSTNNYGIHILSSSVNDITSNTITTNGTSASVGVFISASPNNTITNNTISARGTTTANMGISLSTSSDNTITNNTVSTNGTSSNYGISLSSNSSNNVINANRIFTNGTSSNRGISITSNSETNTLSANNMTTRGAGSQGIFISASNGSSFNNTILNNPVEWLSLGVGTFSNFTNTSFVASNGSVRFQDRIQLNSTLNISRLQFNTTLNRSFLNVTNLSQLNQSAFITLNGLTLSDPQPIADFDNTGTYSVCPADVCTEASYSGGVFVFNVSHWTSYAAQEGPPACGNLSTSVTLQSNVTSAGLCFNLTADNIVLDCDGYTITFDTGGGGAGAGVAAINRNNVTVKNCIIIDTNAAGSQGIGINLTRTNNSFVVNNTLRTNGTNGNYGVLIENAAYDNTVANNTIITRGTSSGNNGIELRTNASRNTLENNNISVFGTSANRGIQIEDSSDNNTVRNNTIVANGTSSGNEGVRLVISAHNNIIVGNAITTGGTLANYAIELGSGSNVTTVVNNTLHTRGSSNANAGLRLATENNLIENNTITTNGTTENHGIRASVSGTIASLALNNTIRDNRIFTGGTSINHGIRLESGSYNNTIESNTITTNGTQSYAISLQDANGTILNNTILDAPAQWLNATPNTNNNMTNTTFQTGNGSIRFAATISLSGSVDINMARLNITANKAYLNSTSLAALNTSAQITLQNINTTNPRPTVDADDDGVFEACSSPQCVEDSYSGGTFIFSVTHFTAYSSQETPAAASASSGGEAASTQPTARYDDCVPSWTCGEWGECSNGRQTRDCVDLYGCGFASPVTEQECAMPVEEKPAAQEPVIPDERPAPVPERPARQVIPMKLVIAIGLTLLVVLSIWHSMRSRKTHRRKM